MCLLRNSIYSQANQSSCLLFRFPGQQSQGGGAGGMGGGDPVSQFDDDGDDDLYN